MSVNAIGELLKNTLNLYTLEHRQTGRTTQMLESLQTEDIVVVSHHHTAQLLRELTKHNFVIVARSMLELDVKLKGLRGRRVVFDHVFIETMYMNAVRDTQKSLLYWQSTKPA